MLTLMNAHQDTLGNYMNRIFILCMCFSLTGCIDENELSKKYQAQNENILSKIDVGSPFSSVRPNFDACLKIDNMECKIPFMAIYGNDKYLNKYIIIDGNLAVVNLIKDEGKWDKKIFLFPSKEFAKACDISGALEIRTKSFDELYNEYKNSTGISVTLIGTLRNRDGKNWRVIELPQSVDGVQRGIFGRPLKVPSDDIIDYCEGNAGPNEEFGATKR